MVSLKFKNSNALIFHNYKEVVVDDLQADIRRLVKLVCCTDNRGKNTACSYFSKEVRRGKMLLKVVHKKSSSEDELLQFYFLAYY